MQLFNWYIHQGLLSGDIVIRKGTKYYEYLKYMSQSKRTHNPPLDFDRELQFIQVGIVTCKFEDDIYSCKTTKYIDPLELVNMDAYFYNDETRRDSQYLKLRDYF